MFVCWSEKGWLGTLQAEREWVMALGGWAFTPTGDFCLPSLDNGRLFLFPLLNPNFRSVLFHESFYLGTPQSGC